MDTIDLGPYAANPSGAPEYGGATSPGSVFGGTSLTAKLLRALARFARDLESMAYRRLRDLEVQEAHKAGTCIRPGAPNRVKHAHNGESRIH
jgi:hypothetical protein